jgi:hypothetical protein
MGISCAVENPVKRARSGRIYKALCFILFHEKVFFKGNLLQIKAKKK